MKGSLSPEEIFRNDFLSGKHELMSLAEILLFCALPLQLSSPLYCNFDFLSVSLSRQWAPGDQGYLTLFIIPVPTVYLRPCFWNMGIPPHLFFLPLLKTNSAVNFKTKLLFLVARGPLWWPSWPFCWKWAWTSVLITDPRVAPSLDYISGQTFLDADWPWRTELDKHGHGNTM